MQVVFLLKKVENNTVYKSDQDLINDFYTKKKKKQKCMKIIGCLIYLGDNTSI